MSRKKLSNLSDVRRFLHRLDTPIFFEAMKKSSH